MRLRLYSKESIIFPAAASKLANSVSIYLVYLPALLRLGFPSEENYLRILRQEFLERGVAI